MKILVINESNAYNLGARRIEAKFRQEGHEVFYSTRAPQSISGISLDSMGVEKAFISLIFTWDLPAAIHDTNFLRQNGVEVEIGGPACVVMPDYIFERCQVRPHIGLDDRFEFIKGDFEMTFSQRGCVRGCAFCLVQFVEGKKIIEYDDFNIPVGDNPKLGDNNLLCCSWKHMELVVDRLKSVKMLDVNSGYDDRIFAQDPAKYFNLFKHLDAESFRFAYDKPEQREPLKKCVDYLHAQGIGYRKITVFKIIGFPPEQTFEECQKELQWLRDIDVSPYPQRYRPFDTIMRNYTPPGWSEGQMDLLFGYYGVGFVYKSCTWEEYYATEKYKLKQVSKDQLRMGI